jgi:uncharacterized repeat protein (TIGR01451 family)
VKHRFFRILDDNDGQANVAGAGFDLDAVQALSSINGPYILLTDYTINDQTGNNNGQLDPGETAEITVVLKNIGTEDALNITGTLPPKILPSPLLPPIHKTSAIC